MNGQLFWAGAGVYVPSIGENLVLWELDTTKNPFVGVEVNSPEHGRTIADVWIETGKSKLAILQQMEKVR